ncbi:MAG: peptide deformylase [Ichthyobacteriaceae bacterium]|nr:peptide deformylase [Ichthyobacteriaceae bacterium]
MVLPVVAYGDPVLRKEGEEINKDYPHLSSLINNMWETMYNANGVGLAAPQIGKAIRLFVIDASPFAEEGEEDYELLKDFKKVFINAKIVDETGEEWAFNEGCLTIPGINEDVFRKETVVIEYYNENFEFKREEYSGGAARVIQHEYDHTEGIMFTDHLSGLKKRLIKGKLASISKGKVSVDYNMRFASKKGR